MMKRFIGISAAVLALAGCAAKMDQEALNRQAFEESLVIFFEC